MIHGFLDNQIPIDWSHPINRGLAAWWMVPPKSGWRGGLTLRDLVRGGRNQHDGTLTSGPVWHGRKERPGGYGCLEFDGTAYVATPTVLINYGETFTIAAWIRPTSSGSAVDGTILSSGANGFYLRRNSGLINFYEGVTRSATLAINFDVWNHVVVVASSNYQFWVNGKDAGTAALGGVGNVTLSSMGQDSGGNPYVGFMDDWHVWNRALSAGQVYGLYAESKAGYPRMLNWVRTQVAETATSPPPPSGKPATYYASLMGA